MCLNCCALQPESINKPRYVSSPINTIFANNGTSRGTYNHKCSPISRQKALLYYCTICDDILSQWMGTNNWPVQKCSAPVHIKISWWPTWDLHYAHLAALGFHWPTVVLSCVGPWSELTEAQMRADIGNGETHISLLKPTQRNVLRLWKRFYQAIERIFCWNCNDNRKKGDSPWKCVRR